MLKTREEITIIKNPNINAYDMILDPIFMLDIGIPFLIGNVIRSISSQLAKSVYSI